MRTDHVALVVLSSPLLCNISLNPQEDNHAIFDGVFLRVEAAQNEEPLSVMNFIAQDLKDIS